jgi:hypothetical protein
MESMGPMTQGSGISESIDVGNNNFLVKAYLCDKKLFNRVVCTFTCPSSSLVHCLRAVAGVEDIMVIVFLCSISTR